MPENPNHKPDEMYFVFQTDEGEEWKIPCMRLFEKYLRQGENTTLSKVMAQVANGVPWNQVKHIATQMCEPEETSMQEYWSEISPQNVDVMAYDDELPTISTQWINWPSIRKSIREIITELFRQAKTDQYYFSTDIYVHVLERNGDAVVSEIDSVLEEMVGAGELVWVGDSSGLVLTKCYSKPSSPYYYYLVYAEIKNRIDDMVDESIDSFSIRDVFDELENHDHRYQYSHFQAMIEAMQERGELVFCSTCKNSVGVNVQQFRKDHEYMFTDTPVIPPLKVS